MPYLFIKVAVDGGVSPVFLSFVRVALAAALLLPLAWRRGALRGLRARLGPLALFAFAEIVLPFPLIAVALGVTLLDESLTATAVAGMLLILAGPWLSTGGRPPTAWIGAQGRLRGWRARGSTTSSTDGPTQSTAALTRA